MEFKAKGIVLIIMLVVSLALAGIGFYLFQSEHVKNIQLTSKVEDLNSKQKIAEKKLSDAQKALSNLEARLKEAMAQVSALTIQLQEEKAAKEESFSRVSQMQETIDQQKKVIAIMESQINKAQDDVRVIKNELKKIGSEKVKLESQIKNLEAKSEVELGKIVVSPEAGQAAQALPMKASGSAQGLEGKVLVLNKEYNFVVVNLGSKDGLVAGELFSVYRGETYLGDIKIEKVQDVMSAAGFVSGDLKNKVKEGDRIVKKSK
jgi:vacuolar-type H+-ATPase subunit I/STV1